jgi:hypothetical protein
MEVDDKATKFAKVHSIALTKAPGISRLSSDSLLAFFATPVSDMALSSVLTLHSHGVHLFDDIAHDHVQGLHHGYNKTTNKRKKLRNNICVTLSPQLKRTDHAKIRDNNAFFQLLSMLTGLSTIHPVPWHSYKNVPISWCKSMKDSGILSSGLPARLVLLKPPAPVVIRPLF